MVVYRTYFPEYLPSNHLRTAMIAPSTIRARLMYGNQDIGTMRASPPTLPLYPTRCRGIGQVIGGEGERRQQKGTKRALGPLSPGH